MATGWETYPVEMNGGLVTNLSLLQQGIKQPGSARLLTNFEPSIRGGYRRINGFNKFSDNVVPRYGDPRVQGSGQSGTTLILGNMLTEPEVGDRFTIEGLADTFEIQSLVFSSNSKEVTITLTAALPESPDDKALVTFVNEASPINGIEYFDNKAIAYRDDSFWSSLGIGWTKISVHHVGTPLVDGASQTGNNITVDGLADIPHVGDTFYIDGVEKVYTVTSEPTVTGGGTTLSIQPALASSPADNAQVTFLSTDVAGGGIVRTQQYNYSGVQKLVFVDGDNYPSRWDGTNFDTILESDLLGSQFVASFSNHMFFAKGSLLTYSAPFDETDYDPGNGAGTIRLPFDITGLIVFRKQLIIFTENTIHNLTGTSQSDFALNVITNKLGCVQPDTIQEVGGDVTFLGPDGLRLLSATQRIGDFGLATISRNIQDDITQFATSYGNYCSVVVREKSQYRIFGFTTGLLKSVSEGYIGTQFVSQEAGSFAWSKTEGIKARVATSVYDNQDEIILFANEDGYVYRMESGNDFDGTTVPSYFYTPYFPLTDPLLRKTIYKTHSYFNPEGSVTGNLALKYDFQGPNKVQPDAIGVTNNSDSFAIYGEATYGESNYGDTPSSLITRQAIGSCNTISLQYTFDSDAPFILDTVLIEFSNKGRK